MMLGAVAASALVARQLGDTPRARHSIFVGHIMRRLAAATGHDAGLWYVTGLVHDLDYVETANDRSQHGLLAAEWLAGELPEDALAAIRAHDHRTGVMAFTPLAHALRLADALAITMDSVGSEAGHLLAQPEAAALLTARLAARPYLVPLLVDNARAIGLDLDAVARLLADAPPSS
jgi:hypothetical protein